MFELVMRKVKLIFLFLLDGNLRDQEDKQNGLIIKITCQ